MERGAARDAHHRRVLAVAMALSLAAHGALFALGGFEVEVPVRDADGAAARQLDEPTRAETPLRVVRLRTAPAVGESGGEPSPAAAAPRRTTGDGQLELSVPTPSAAASTVTPRMQTVAADRPRPARIAWTEPEAARRDPAVRAFRARMEGRDDRVDYRAASRAARRAEDDGDRGVAGGRYGGVGPGCENPRGGATDRFPLPAGGGPRR